ncbi:Mlp family lipoprotein (plasmid) [Borrelia sp. CA_690]|uniref:Mlp family lipoprotein n=1 Tax=Borrelia maritima TaxID=2761123 RepID=A0A5J6WC39_9SPIR|nr:Mlp family lipoprotein [Borrelia maritima]QFI15090.1 Mlp family lipoprotein [Borrelia maritima]
MKIINILFCLSLLILNSCNTNDNDTLNNNTTQQVKSRKKRDLSQQEESLQEKITLTPEEEKMFTSLKALFTYTVEKLYDHMQECSNGNKNKCKDKCNNFFNWLSKDSKKQKELAKAFTKVFNFLESKRKSKANNEDFDTYIKGAIDKNSGNNNKYGNGSDNEIRQYFKGVADITFSHTNSNDEIYKCLKEELLKENSHYASLTSWKQ